MTFHLRQHEDIAAGLRRIAHEQIGIVLTGFADDSVPREEQVHILRARCKKMRSLLRLAQPALGDAFESEDLRFREAARELAEYRDRDVIARTVLALGTGAPDAVLARHPIPTDAIQRAVAMMVGARDAVDGWPLGGLDGAGIAAGFAQTYGACRESWQQVKQEPDDEKFHSWRKWTKYHWYQVRMLERVNKAVLRERRKLLWELQRALGEAHDLVMLEQAVGSWENPDDVLLRRVSSRKREFYARATSIGPGVLASEQQDVHTDVTRWWSAWRV